MTRKDYLTTKLDTNVKVFAWLMFEPAKAMQKEVKKEKKKITINPRYNHSTTISDTNPAKNDDSTTIADPHGEEVRLTGTLNELAELAKFPWACG